MPPCRTGFALTRLLRMESVHFHRQMGCGGDAAAVVELQLPGYCTANPFFPASETVRLRKVSGWQQC